MLNTVWVVSYCLGYISEPIVSVYDNKEAAYDFYNYLKEKYTSRKGDFSLAIDECPICSNFTMKFGGKKK